jgi:hypothetical protein
MNEQVLPFEAERRPATRVVMLRETRQRHGAVLHAFALAGAVVEEVTEIPALLARMRREPRPDLVVLGLEDADVGGEALRPELPRGADGARTRDTLMQLLRSAERLVAAAHVEPRDAAAGLRTGVAAETDMPAANGLDLRLDASRAFWKGQRVDLSLTEFRIVSQLARSRGRDFSHRELYDIIKGDGFVSGPGRDGYRCNVRAAIKRIRQKFRLTDPAFAAIRSYHGFGYRWDERAEDDGGEEPGVAA